MTINLRSSAGLLHTGKRNGDAQLNVPAFEFSKEGVAFQSGFILNSRNPSETGLRF